MSTNLEGGQLTKKRYMTLVLRFALDEQREIERITIMDVQGQSVAHLRLLQELPQVILGWLQTKIREHR